MSDKDWNATRFRSGLLCWTRYRAMRAAKCFAQN
ncbi:Uncharacterised protein [Mycobacteroides abscessus subsp. abscessus]|nr:Uncharacterised protein [Mycobacteroides abscessus subsp. abscessus]